MVVLVTKSTGITSGLHILSSRPGCTHPQRYHVQDAYTQTASDSASEHSQCQHIDATTGKVDLHDVPIRLLTNARPSTLKPGVFCKCDRERDLKWCVGVSKKYKESVQNMNVNRLLASNLKTENAMRLLGSDRDAMQRIAFSLSTRSS